MKKTVDFQPCFLNLHKETTEKLDNTSAVFCLVTPKRRIPPLFFISLRGRCDLVGFYPTLSDLISFEIYSTTGGFHCINSSIYARAYFPDSVRFLIPRSLGTGWVSEKRLISVFRSEVPRTQVGEGLYARQSTPREWSGEVVILVNA